MLLRGGEGGRLKGPAHSDFRAMQVQQRWLHKSSRMVPIEWKGGWAG